MRDDALTTKKSPTIPKPRKAIPCTVSPDPDETGRNYARLITAPEVAAYRITMACEPSDLSEQVDAPGMLAMLKHQAEAFSSGEMQHAEAMLSAQATALQTLFARLTERAMGQTQMQHIEGFMRLALRAQSQSRATLETLATIRNPPIVYARQANVTTGPQQINNGAAAPSRAQKIEGEQNELLESSDGKRLDAGAAGTAGGVDSQLATVGAGKGTEHR